MSAESVETPLPKPRTKRVKILPTVSTLTVDIGDLKGLLADALVCGGTNDSLPVLCSVKVELIDGALTAAATDRYRLSHVRLPLQTTAAPFTFLLRNSDVAAISRIFRTTRKQSMDVSLTVTRPHPDELASLRVEQVGTLAGVSGLTATFEELPGKFPEYQKFLDEARNDASAGVTDIHVNPFYLASFDKVRNRHNKPMRLRFVADNKPILIEIGDHFSAALMPVRRNT